MGARHKDGEKQGGLVGSPQRILAVFLVVAVLVGLNIRQATSRAVGPDPELEALHSPQEALQVCRVALDSQLLGQDPEIVRPLQVEYFQGGEYEVTGTVDVRVGGRRVRRDALCELQFRPESGWTVGENVLTEG